MHLFLITVAILLFRHVISRDPAFQSTLFETGPWKSTIQTTYPPSSYPTPTWMSTPAMQTTSTSTTMSTPIPTLLPTFATLSFPTVGPTATTILSRAPALIPASVMLSCGQAVVITLDSPSDNAGISTHNNIQATTASILASQVGNFTMITSPTVSANPFRRSKVVLVFMGCVAGFILLMLSYLLRLDHYEKMKKTYVKNESDIIARKLLEEDIMSGGKGDLGEAYRMHVKGLNKNNYFGESIAISMKKVLSTTHSSRAMSSNASMKSHASRARRSMFRARLDSAVEEDDEDSDGVAAAEDPRQIARIAVVSDFLNKLFPGRSIFSGERNIAEMVFDHHEHCKMLGGSTLTKTRTIRFLEVVALVLVSVFADTVFFGLYFPPYSLCTTMTTKATCVSLPSKVQHGVSLCQWEQSGASCSARPPPLDAKFTILVALLIAILSIPVILVIEFVLLGPASNVPGSRGFEDDIRFQKEEMSKKEEELAELNIANELLRASCQSDFGEIIKQKVQGGNASKAATSSEVAQMAYADLLSPFDEAMMITQSVRLFLSVDDNNESQLPWGLAGVTDTRIKDRGAKIKAIEEHLGVLPNGTNVPLTSRQKLFFGTARVKLEYKIQKARAKAKEIIEVIEGFKLWEADMKDSRLMRHFILECLSPFKRYTLEINNAAYDKSTAQRSSWLVYIASWAFVSGSLLFFMYWIFAWGLYERGDTLAAWGAIYGTGAANDILLVSVTKIILVNYLPAQAMQAQLLRIRRVLADVSLNYINRQDSKFVIADGVDEGHPDTIRVVQHMSAACRAARSEKLNALPAAWLLRQLDDIDVLRCREGRLDYLGSISFFVIAIPITLLLMNNAIGDAAVDAIIPAVYCSMLVVCAALHSVSLTALLIPLIVLVAIGLYIPFVYRPSLEAYNRRKELLKTSQLDGTFSSRSMSRLTSGPHSSWTDLNRYLRKISSIAKHSIQHGVIMLSTRSIDIRRDRESRDTKTWSDMNVPMRLKDCLTAKIERSVKFGRSIPTSSDLSVANSKLCPIKISVMVVPSPYGRIKSVDHAQVRKIAKTRREAITVKRESVVTRVEEHYHPVSKLLKSYFVFTAQEAISIIREMLSSYSVSVSDEHLTVPIVDLFREFENIFSVFYPDGIPMTAVEISEACEQFVDWKDGLVVRHSVTIMEVETIDFLHFQEWFSDQFLKSIRDVITDRLLDHTLRQVLDQKRRLPFTVIPSFLRDSARRHLTQMDHPRTDPCRLFDVIPSAAAGRIKKVDDAFGL